MRHLLATYKVRRGSEVKVIAAAGEFVEAVRRSEPGTLVYEAFQEMDGVSFVHFMVFRDREAEEFHRSTPHVKKFVDILYPNCELEPQFTELQPVASARREGGEPSLR